MNQMKGFGISDSDFGGGEEGERASKEEEPAVFVGERGGGSEELRSALLAESLR